MAPRAMAAAEEDGSDAWEALRCVLAARRGARALGGWGTGGAAVRETAGESAPHTHTHTHAHTHTGAKREA